MRILNGHLQMRSIYQTFYHINIGARKKHIANQIDKREINLRLTRDK